MLLDWRCGQTGPPVFQTRTWWLIGCCWELEPGCLLPQAWEQAGACLGRPQLAGFAPPALHTPFNPFLSS